MVHAPTRSTRDIDVKRRIITEVLRYESMIDSEWGCCHGIDSIAAGDCPSTDPDEIHGLQLLASAYADHPDYRQEWHR